MLPASRREWALASCWWCAGPLTGWRATLVALMGFGYYGAAFLLAPLFRLEALTPAAGRLLLLFAVPCRR